jgi:5-methyltetrahydrofolate--homocysteine methyltransferase
LTPEKSTANSDHPGILDRLATGQILVLDGATGTYLQEHGLEPGGCPELMNDTNPDVVRQMASDYFAAGSDMVLTNSFGSNVFGLVRYGAGDRVRELNRKAAEIARSAAPEGKFVVGSVGPTGKFIEPLGEVSEDEMYDALAEQITGLEEGGADAVMIETQLALEEAALAVRAAKENTNMVVMSTMTFTLGPRGYFTLTGLTPEKAVGRLYEAGADIVGANCGEGIDRMLEIAKRMRAATDRYLVIQSNAGIPTIVNRETCYLETPEFMAERYQKMAKLPVNILGGCCGTIAEHIRALVETLKGEAATV